MKVAIIGCGGIGRLHSRVYQTIPGVEFLYMVDTVKEAAEAAAAQFGGKPLTDIHEMTEMPDIVSVTTPPNLHTDITLYFIEKGIPVFCEKPLTTDIEEAKRVVAAADKYNVPVGIGFKMRNEPIFKEARKYIDRIGKIYSVSAVKNQPHHAPNKDHWTCHTGCMYELSVHEYDLITFISGLIPQEVRAELCYDYGWEKENRAYLSVNYSDGVKAQLMSSYSADTSFTFSDLALTFTGEKGYMRIERPNRIFLHTDCDEIIDVQTEDNYLATDAEIKAFVEAIRNGTRPVPDCHDGANMTFMVEAARTSSHTGKYEPIERV